MKRLILWGLVAAAFNLLPPPARVHACSCVPMSDCRAYTDAVGVFTGRLVKAEYRADRGRPEVDATFTVEEVYKGAPPEKVTLTYSSGDCGTVLIVGRRYIVFREGYQRQSLCNRTDLLEESERTLEFVKEISSGVPKFTITGFVLGASEEQLGRTLVSINGIERKLSIDDGNVGKFNFITSDRNTYRVAILLPGSANIQVTDDVMLLKEDARVRKENDRTALEYDLPFQPRSCAVRRIQLLDPTDLR